MQAALDLAARGFRVFPLMPGTKRPAVEGWPEMATIDAERIRQWWSDQVITIGFTKRGDDVMSNPNFNVGVACGHGLLGLDIDVKNGKQGIASAKALGVKATGFAVETPSGGVHIYYKAPDVSNAPIGDGLDIRSDRAYLVGPGSTVDGKPYRLVADNDPEPVPPAVIHACTSIGPGRRGGDQPAVDPDREDSIERATLYLVDVAPLASEGQSGDLTTFKVAAHLKDIGVSEDMAAELMAEHWNDRCSPPWHIEDLKTKVRNAYEYGARPIGDLHPMADFKDVKVPKPDVIARPGRQWFHHGDAAGAVDWLYYQMLPKVGVGVLLAESQAGKTFLAINLAQSLATGKSFFKIEPDDRGATLFLFAGTEGSGFPQRLAALGEEQPLPIGATYIGNLSETNALPQLLEDLRAEAAVIKERFGLPVRLIVLETMAASALLNDENDNAEASRAMANLATISREMGAFVLTSHHPAKDGKGARGASAIPNSADIVIEISRQGEIREAALKKARDAEQRDLGTFTLLTVELGKDERGRPITSKVVSTGEAMSREVRAAPHFEKLVEALEWAVADGDCETLPDGRTGVEFSIARDKFLERKGGSRDRSNVLKTFKAALAWGEQIARVDVVGWNTEKFLVLRTVEIAA